MAILHGSWIVNSQNNKLFIWGETWRTQESVATNLASKDIPIHPLAMSVDELLNFADEHKLSWADTDEVVELTQVMLLPSEIGKKGKAKVVKPVLSGQIGGNTEDLVWHPWQVTGVSFSPLAAIKFLSTLPLGSFERQNSYLSSDLRFWSQIYRWSLDLLARRKFLPRLLFNSDEEPRGIWHVLLDSTLDKARLGKFTRLMPSVCLADQVDLETKEFALVTEPQRLIVDFLNAVADAQLSSWLPNHQKSSRDTVLQQWLKALCRNNGSMGGNPQALARLATALNTWMLPVQDYLSENLLVQWGQSQFRICFILEPPTPAEIKWKHFDWKLLYYLRSVDDPEFLVPSEFIWQYTEEELVYYGRTMLKPQETLLKGLGLAARLYAPIKDSLDQPCPMRCMLNPIQVYEFVRAIAWQLQDNGLGVIVPPGLTSGAGETRLGVTIKAEVKQKKGQRLSLNSLLTCKLELSVGDQAISEEDFKEMMAQRSPLVQVNGQWIALQPADVKAAQAVLSSSHELTELRVEDALRLSTGDTKTLAKLPVTNFQASGILEDLIKHLNDNQEVEAIATPEAMRGDLRPYQQRGVGWLAFLERWGLGACLADDMGLGKTLQLIAFLLHLQQEGHLNKPTLVVCPTSVLGNWEREIAKFAPTLKSIIHHGDKRKKDRTFTTQVKKYDVVLTSYSLVYRDEKTLGDVNWLGVVLDEAQNIKNPQAKQSQAARKLKAGFRVALTGTPIENRLSELWSILDFLNPGFLGNRQFFQRRFAIPIEKYGDRDSLVTLRSLVQPFILRRLKTDQSIIQDLPDKQEMNVFCGLSAEQASLYQQLVDESLEKIDEAEGIQRHGLVLKLLMKLKQVCNHPAHFLKQDKLDSAARSGKLLRLEEMLEELVSEGDRALIFTQFSEWGKLLMPYLATKLGVEVIFLYGATRRQQREAMVERFQNDPDGPRIFILSLKAGGTGLNLTRANHVFHVDRWWNPAVENQATDRAFRIGQKKNVQVHKFICTGTLEERINATLESKMQLAEQTVDSGENWLTELDTDQLRNLLLLDRDRVIDEEEG